MNLEIMAVNTKTLYPYYFLNDGETEEDLLKRAYEHKKENIKRYTELLVEYPGDSEYWNSCLKSAESEEYKIMTFDEYLAAKRFYMLGDNKITEVTEEQFEHSLNVLPPLHHISRDGIEMFCISEMYSGNFTTQYARYNGKYYSKMVDVMDESTWIYHFLLEEKNNE